MVAGEKESDGDGDEGGGRATATRAKTTAMRAMVMVTGVACDKEARARVMMKAMRVVRDEEGVGSKAMATATRVAGERWQWQRGWWARKRTRLARAMGMATKRRRRDDDETTTRQRRDVMTTRRRRDDVMTMRRRRDDASARKKQRVGRGWIQSKIQGNCGPIIQRAVQKQRGFGVNM